METNNYKVVIGKRINTLLAKHDKSQKELAEYIGVLPNVISYFCKGTRTPNTEQIIKIADFFDVTTDYLFGRTDIETTDTTIQGVCEYTGLSEYNIEKITRFTAEPALSRAFSTLLDDTNLLLFLFQLDDYAIKCNCENMFKLEVLQKFISEYKLNVSEEVYIKGEDIFKGNNSLSKHELEFYVYYGMVKKHYADIDIYLAEDIQYERYKLISELKLLVDITATLYRDYEEEFSMIRNFYHQLFNECKTEEDKKVLIDNFKSNKPF